MTMHSPTPEQCSEKLLEIVPSIGRLIRFELAKVIGKEVTMAQYRALHLLRNRTLNNKEVADWIGISLPVASRMMDLLVKRRLIQRVQSQKDRRQVQLTITNKGRNLYRDAKLRAEEHFVAPLAALPQKDRARLYEGLLVLSETFSRSEDLNETSSYDSDLPHPDSTPRPRTRLEAKRE